MNTKLVDAIALNSNYPKTTVHHILKEFVAQVEAAAIAGEDIKMTGFGTFEVRDRAARAGRNPQTGETIEIPATRSLGFKPSKSLKAKLRDTLQ